MRICLFILDIRLATTSLAIAANTDRLFVHDDTPFSSNTMPMTVQKYTIAIS